MQSMTGFAASDGAVDSIAWRWEMRSVNGKSLDVRYRGAEGYDRLEPLVRAAAQKKLSRGSVSINLRVSRVSSDAAAALNPDALAAAAAATAAADRDDDGQHEPGMTLTENGLDR